ncbi:MAG: DUF188 domain-containing protein [Longicatena sp.]
MFKILIDADGCPVVEESIDIGEFYNIPVVIVADSSHVFAYEGVETIICDKGKDRADFVLLQKVNKNDIVVTQDYGLATLVLSRQAYPISQNGLRYSDDNIDALLLSRHQGSIARKHKKYGSPMKKRTSDDDARFITSLRALVLQILESNDDKDFL